MAATSTKTRPRVSLCVCATSSMLLAGVLGSAHVARAQDTAARAMNSSMRARDSLATTQDTLSLTRVELVINASYDDSEQSLAQLRRLLAVLPPIQDTLREAQTIGQLIVERYGFGESTLPRSYAMFRDYILARNHIEDATQSQIGPLLVPRLPTRSTVKSRAPAGVKRAAVESPITERARRSWRAAVDSVRGSSGEANQPPPATAPPSSLDSTRILRDTGVARVLDFEKADSLQALGMRRAASHEARELVRPRVATRTLKGAREVTSAGHAGGSQRIVPRDTTGEAANGSVDLPSGRQALGLARPAIGHDTVQGEPAMQQRAPTNAAVTTGDTVIKFSLTSADAEELLASDSTLAASFGIRIADQPLLIAFDSVRSSGADSVVLDSSETTTIARVAARARRRVPLYILDECWPSRAAYDSAAQWLTRVSDRIRKSNELFPSRTNDLARRKNFGLAPPGSHCYQIDSALASVAAIDSAGQHVHTIYIPLSRSQNADPFYRELFELHSLLIQNREVIAGSRQAVRRSTARADAELALRVISRASNSPRTIPSSKAIIEALCDVADTLAALDSTMYVVNMSWTIANRVLQSPFASQPRGIAIAAAGNIPNIDVVNDRIDFAQLANTTRFVIAVINQNRMGDTICGTSTVRQDSTLVSDMMLVGYNGELPGGECATSFAAPRIAWFIALNEAARTGELRPESWSRLLKNQLTSSRVRAWDIAGVRFDPQRFFKAVVSNPNPNGGPP